MVETWEYRESDIDLKLCRKNNIAVLGTNEEDPRINITGYLGPLALKIIYEMNLNFSPHNVLIIDNGKFGKHISLALNNRDINAKVVMEKKLNGKILSDKLKHTDLLIICSY